VAVAGVTYLRWWEVDDQDQYERELEQLILMRNLYLWLALACLAVLIGWMIGLTIW
jgi:hypothetical protein